MRVIHTDVGPLRVVATRDDAVELWGWLRARQHLPLGLDAETNAEDPFSAAYRLRLVQMADEREGWVIQAQRPGMSDVIQACVRVHPYWVAHYAENDLRFIERAVPGSFRLGQKDPHLACTQPMLAYYDPRTRTTQSKKENIPPGVPLSAGLKSAVSRILKLDVLSDAENAKDARARELAPVGFRTAKANRKWGFANLADDDEAYLRYAGLDSICEIRLFNHMRAELVRRGQWNCVARDLRWQWHIDQMTLRGEMVDPEYVERYDRYLDSVLDHYSAHLALCGIKPSGSGAAVGAAFQAMGESSPKRTGNGNESWDKDVLPGLAERPGPVGDLAQSISIVRKCTKFRATYVKPMLESLERDGFIHCSMRAIGTLPGRNSAARPALQQIPKRTDTKVRAAFCAPNGWVLVSADFRQGEPRTMAGLSQDPQLIRDLLEGDLNGAIARTTYGVQYNPAEGKDPRTKSYAFRQLAKFAFLAWCYGAGFKKIAMLLGLPETEATNIRQKWHARYPRLITYAKQLNAQPAVYLESGRVCPLWDRYYVDAQGVHCGPKPSRLGLNYITQGTQRDLLAVAVHRLIDWGWSEYFWFFLHDEILLCVPEYMAQEAKAALEAAMTMDFHGVPIECDAEINGRTWLPQLAEFDLTEVIALTADENGDAVMVGA
ncbi:MAG: DNA polymerase [Candidatus Binatia bacterium]